MLTVQHSAERCSVCPELQPFQLGIAVLLPCAAANLPLPVQICAGHSSIGFALRILLRSALRIPHQIQRVLAACVQAERHSILRICNSPHVLVIMQGAAPSASSPPSCAAC